MKQESLDKTLDSIFAHLNNLNIDTTDKIELMLNLKLLLENVDRYNQSIRVLQREIPSKKEVYKGESIRRH